MALSCDHCASAQTRSSVMCRYLHKSRPMVIHRDLKLENVLLGSKCCTSLLTDLPRCSSISDTAQSTFASSACVVTDSVPGCTSGRVQCGQETCKQRQLPLHIPQSYVSAASPTLQATLHAKWLLLVRTCVRRCYSSQREICGEACRLWSEQACAGQAAGHQPAQDSFRRDTNVPRGIGPCPSQGCPDARVLHPAGPIHAAGPKVCCREGSLGFPLQRAQVASVRFALKQHVFSGRPLTQLSAQHAAVSDSQLCRGPWHVLKGPDAASLCFHKACYKQCCPLCCAVVLLMIWRSNGTHAQSHPSSPTGHL